MDFSPVSIVTASSQDTVSDACIPNKCNPRQTTINDASVDTSGTFWQSSAAGQVGTKCPEQYLQYDMSSAAPSALTNMTILYGNQSFVFDGQKEGTVTTGPIVTITTVGSTAPVTAVAGKDYVFSSTHVSMPNGSPARVDTFLPLSNLLKNQVQTVRFTWDSLVLQKPLNICQMNVMETNIWGAPSASAVDSSVTVGSSSSPVSVAAIVGAAVGSLVLISVSAAICIHRKNVAARKKRVDKFVELDERQGSP
ncbi:hypothetical protein BDR26DRAFT_851455 [Obelidium mucronatum]|nr:hypothetical protein BDR26DRAFT_851455 [Obelidium mucronatum]